MTSSVVFVAGATGFVGRATVEALCRRDDTRVVAHVRPDSSRLDQWRDRFGDLGAEVDTTAWDADAMRERLAELQPSHVFALLGTTKKRARAEGIGDPYERIDYGLTAVLIDAASVCGSKPRFVYLSSAGLGKRRPRSPYMLARWKAEAKLRESGLPYTIARPSFITGPGRDDERPGERVGAAVADSALRVASLLGGRKLRSRYRSTTNEILGAALARLGFDPAAEGHILEGDELR